MRWKTFIFGLIVAGGGAAAFLHYGGLQALQKAEAPVAAPPQMPPQKVAVVTVEPQQIPVVSDLPGRIAPTRIAEVRPRVSGILIERVFTQGARVEKGDVSTGLTPSLFRSGLIALLRPSPRPMRRRLQRINPPAVRLR